MFKNQNGLTTEDAIDDKSSKYCGARGYANFSEPYTRQ